MVIPIEPDSHNPVWHAVLPQVGYHTIYSSLMPHIQCAIESSLPGIVQQPTV